MERTALTRSGALRVPEVTIVFWVIKGLSTAVGESSSDYLVHAVNPELAVVGGFLAFVAALAVQFHQQRYVAWAYWLAVVMVGIFGTMAADVLHVGFGVPYLASAVFYAAILGLVFAVWHRTEGTLSIHSIDTPRREAFYWATVVATFAMGTAVGDLAAYTFHLGYFPSAAIFAVAILIPALGRNVLGWSAVGCFWAAYVLTRPLGASLADGLGKAKNVSGMNLGDGKVTLVGLLLIAALVAILSATRADVQAPTPRGSRLS